jgi:hypothetical protein
VGNGGSCVYYQITCIGFSIHIFVIAAGFLGFNSSRLMGCSSFRLRLFGFGSPPGGGQFWPLRLLCDGLKMGLGLGLEWWH